MALTDEQIADLQQAKADIEAWEAEEQAKIQDQVDYLRRINVAGSELSETTESSILDEAEDIISSLLTS